VIYRGPFGKWERRDVGDGARLRDRLWQAARGQALPGGSVRQHPRGPRGPGGKNSLPALLVAALDEPVTVTINGHRRKITKREAIVAQMVDKSTRADLRATKMLIDMLKEAEEKAGTAAPEPAKLTPPDREVVDQFVARLRRQIAAEAAAAAASEEEACEKIPNRLDRRRASFETTAPRSPQDEELP